MEEHGGSVRILGGACLKNAFVSSAAIAKFFYQGNPLVTIAFATLPQRCYQTNQPLGTACRIKREMKIPVRALIEGVFALSRYIPSQILASLVAKFRREDCSCLPDRHCLQGEAYLV